MAIERGKNVVVQDPIIINEYIEEEKETQPDNNIVEENFNDNDNINSSKLVEIFARLNAMSNKMKDHSEEIQELKNSTSFDFASLILSIDNVAYAICEATQLLEKQQEVAVTRETNIEKKPDKIIIKNEEKQKENNNTNEILDRSDSNSYINSLLKFFEKYKKDYKYLLIGVVVEYQETELPSHLINELHYNIEYRESKNKTANGTLFLKMLHPEELEDMLSFKCIPDYLKQSTYNRKMIGIYVFEKQFVIPFNIIKAFDNESNFNKIRSQDMVESYIEMSTDKNVLKVPKVNF